MWGSNSIAMAACSHKPLHLHPFSFHQSDAARCQFRLQPCHQECGHLPHSTRRRHGFYRSYFPLTPNGSQLQLDLVCNGKAVNVAAKLQISCGGAGEQNRNLIDRIWKRESRHSSGSKRLQHSEVYYRERNGSRTDTVWGFPFVSGMHVTKRFKMARSYFQTSTSHTMDLPGAAADGCIAGLLLQPDFWQHAAFRWFMAAVLPWPVDTFAILRTIS